jgi:hypothetical protein
MRVRFLRGTALGGVGNDACPGEVRDLPNGQAASLVALGRAVAEPEAPPDPAPAPAATPAAPASPSRKKGK